MWSFFLTIAAFVLYAIHLIVTLAIRSGASAMSNPMVVQDSTTDGKRKMLLDEDEASIVNLDNDFGLDEGDLVESRIGASLYHRVTGGTTAEGRRFRNSSPLVAPAPIEPMIGTTLFGRRQ